VYIVYLIPRIVVALICSAELNTFVIDFKSESRRKSMSIKIR